MVKIDMQRLREALPERAVVILKKKVSGNGITVYIECIVRFPSLYETGTKEEEQTVEQVFKWQEEIIGKENISEFYTEETGSHWFIYLKRVEMEFINTTDEDANSFSRFTSVGVNSRVFKPGDKVKVMRQIGKHGIPAEVTGKILEFSEMIRREGEITARVKYDDNGEDYYHGISTLEKV